MPSAMLAYNSNTASVAKKASGRDSRRLALSSNVRSNHCVAAVMAGKLDVKGKTVCALLSGGNVDVTGLLCGCDMADAVRAERERGLQLALIPRVVFNDDAVTLDDMSLEDMEKRAGARMSVVSCNASDYLLEIIHLVGRTDPTS